MIPSSPSFIHSSMEEEEDDDNKRIESTSYLNLRGRACDLNNHGGMRAASFLLALQTFEISAVAAVGNNLITYLLTYMHFSLSTSANIVTNFIGTLFLLSLLGGFLSDSYLGSFFTLLFFGSLEISGFLLLFFQASLPCLRPPPCATTASSSCPQVDGIQKAVLFLGLYMVALGSGCVKPNMIAYGADQLQFHQTTRKKLPSYFNAAYFAFSLGELLALSAFVWIQTHFGMQLGFAVSASAMLIGLLLFSCGSPFYVNRRRPRRNVLTPIAQVFVAAFFKRNMAWPSDKRRICRRRLGEQDKETQEEETKRELSHSLQWLNKACVKTLAERNDESPWKVCSVDQVELAKSIISVIPIVACTIVFNTILAQLQTFSVQQAAAMDATTSSGFSIPPASMQAIPYIIMLFLVPVYDAALVPAMRRISGKPRGISPLQRMGSGLVVATASMAAAAVVERWRRGRSVERGEKVSVFWVSPQYVIFGVGEMLTAVGLLEFLYEEGAGEEEGMESVMMGITYCSYSLGFYLSSVLVTGVNNLSGGWLSYNDLDKDRLDLFYWMMAAASFVNFFVFLFWSYRYLTRSSSTSSGGRE